MRYSISPPSRCPLSTIRGASTIAGQELDPITLQVISGALDTIAEEMGHILYRMSFSSIIRESQDLGAGLFDTEFNTLCESESTPLHIGSLLLDAETSEIKVPSNQGSFRPINVIAPKGSIYNPNFPAAAEARFSQINRVIDLIYKALAPVLPNDIIAGSSASLSFAAYSGVKPDGEYWVFLEVNEGSYGGRPASDGPDSIDNLMANTRNNPLEDLAIHLPMICDRYELRDDVMPGAGRFRGGLGVVKKQRILTDGFITHECDRHTDVPWGIFGGGEGQCGAVEIYNAARPDEVTDMPAKFAGLRVSPGDVMAFYGPCGGGYGDPLDRPAEKVLEDVLDDFCTVEHAKSAYGVVVNLDTETVDVAATKALRSRMRADPGHGVSSPASVDRRGDDARRAPRAALAASTAVRPAASTADRLAAAGSGERAPGPSSDRSAVRRASPLAAASPAGSPSVEDLVARLNERLGDDWSFDVQRHHRNGGGIEVRAELESNGTRVQRTGTSNGNGSLPLGAQIEMASEAALRSCAAEMLGAANRG